MMESSLLTTVSALIVCVFSLHIFSHYIRPRSPPLRVKTVELRITSIPKTFTIGDLVAMFLQSDIGFQKSDFRIHTLCASPTNPSSMMATATFYRLPLAWGSELGERTFLDSVTVTLNAPDRSTLQVDIDSHWRGFTVLASSNNDTIE